MKRIVALAVCTALIATASAADWPQFRGPNRDGKSAEDNLLQSWPDGGPKQLWSAGDLGHGFASTAIVGETAYTAGNRDGQYMVTALNVTDGSKRWQVALEPASGGGHPGTRSTPTIDGDRLYVLSDGGTLYCLKTADGEAAWKENILKRYKAPNITWRLAESPLIDGDRVICTPGGEAALAALDKTTGKEIWTTPAVDRKTNYASARIIEHGGLRQIVTFSQQHVFGVRASDGKLLWKHEHKTAYDVNATSVAFYKGVLYLTSGYGTGGEALKLTVADGNVSVRSLWTDKTLDDQFGGVVRLKDKVFGTGHKHRGLTALDLATGKVLYRGKGPGQASIIYGDGRLYVQGHNGTVALVNPANGETVSSFTITDLEKKMWAHPAISDGRLYIRHDDTLSCYQIRAK